MAPSKANILISLRTQTPFMTFKEFLDVTRAKNDDVKNLIKREIFVHLGGTSKLGGNKKYSIADACMVEVAMQIAKNDLLKLNKDVQKIAIDAANNLLQCLIRLGTEDFYLQEVVYAGRDSNGNAVTHRQKQGDQYLSDKLFITIPSDILCLPVVKRCFDLMQEKYPDNHEFLRSTNKKSVITRKEFDQAIDDLVLDNVELAEAFYPISRD